MFAVWTPSSILFWIHCALKQNIENCLKTGKYWFFSLWQSSLFHPLFCSISCFFNSDLNFFYVILNFIFFKEVTKIDKIFNYNLTFTTKHQMDCEDFIHFCGLLRKHELYPNGIKTSTYLKTPFGIIICFNYYQTF